MKNDIRNCLGTNTGRYLLAVLLLTGLLAVNQYRRAEVAEGISEVNRDIAHVASLIANTQNEQVRQLGGVVANLPMVK